MSRVPLLLVLFGLASSASAQVFYEPVQYQYDAGGTTYYYGGSNPRVHAFARLPYNAAGTWGRINGFSFVSADMRSHREVDDQPARVFTDATGLTNARQLGYTADDARNDAYAAVPRYWAKRDVPAMAVRVDNHWSVPAAAAAPIRVYKGSGEEITPRATTLPKPLMIIPKDILQPKASDNKMVSAE